MKEARFAIVCFSMSLNETIIRVLIHFYFKKCTKTNSVEIIGWILLFLSFNPLNIIHRIDALVSNVFPNKLNF